MSLQEERDTETHRGEVGEDSQGLEPCGHKPRGAWSHQKLHESGKILPWSLQPLPTLRSLASEPGEKVLLLLCTLKPWLFVRTVEEPKLCPETCAWRAAAGACSPAVTLRGLPSRQGAPSASRHLSLHKRTRDESEKNRGTVAWGRLLIHPGLPCGCSMHLCPLHWPQRPSSPGSGSPGRSSKRKCPQHRAGTHRAETCTRHRPLCRSIVWRAGPCSPLEPRSRCVGSGAGPN